MCQIGGWICDFWGVEKCIKFGEVEMCQDEVNYDPFGLVGRVELQLMGGNGLWRGGAVVGKPSQVGQQVVSRRLTSD